MRNLFGSGFGSRDDKLFFVGLLICMMCGSVFIMMMKFLVVFVVILFVSSRMGWFFLLVGLMKIV